MIHKSIFLAAAAAAAVLAAMPASAAPLLFTLTGSRTATFTYDPATTTPTFLSDTFIGQQVSYNSLPGTFGGVAGNAFVGFGNNLAAALNIQSPNLGFTQFVGPELFTLVNNRPQFNLGTFSLTSIVSGRSSLTIALAPAVPEPATWAMMILGVGMAGGAVRYRRRKTAVSFA